MLKGLEAVDWKTLKHARGSAKNLPPFLSGLLAPDKKARDEASFNLDYTLYDAGRVFSATPYVVPFLLQLLADANMPERERVLALLANVAVGGTDARLTHGANMNDAATKKVFAKSPAKDSYRAVLEGKATYLSLLSHENPKLRAGAAFVLAFLFDARDEAFPAVRAALAKEGDPHAKASLALAVGMLAGYEGAKAEGKSLAPLVDGQPPLLAGAAAAALFLVDRGELPAPAQRRLAALALLGDVGGDRFPWCGGHADRLAERFLREQGEHGSDLAAQALADAAIANASEKLPNDPRPRDLLRRALGAYFTPSAADGVLASDLSAAARALVVRVSGGEIDGPFDELGLPMRAADRRRWLGVDPPGPLDRVIPVEVGDVTHDWPVWKCFEAFSRKKITAEKLGDTLKRSLSPRDVLDAYGEAALHTYRVSPPSTDALLAAVEDAGSDALVWAKRYAEALEPMGERAPQEAALACLVPIVRALEGKPLAPRFDPLVRATLKIDPRPEVFAILRAVPLERRDALVISLMRAVPNQAFALARGVPYLELCPTEKMANAVASYIADVNPSSTPIDRAMAALEAMGKVAEGALARVRDKG